MCIKSNKNNVKTLMVFLDFDIKNAHINKL